LLSEPVDAWLDGLELGEDPADRADALARAIVAVAPATLPLGRRLIALTVAAPPDPAAEGPARRGYRRVGWIERALQPARDRLGPERHARLVSACPSSWAGRRWSCSRTCGASTPPRPRTRCGG
jgi:hypothetical protein